MGQVITFPLERVKKASERERLPERLTILVAEDNDALREIVTLYLSRQGYSVRSARDGKEALARMVREQIHVLLLDVKLPELDGFMVLRHVRDD